jgi:ribosomal protein S18 acetylase RimI-like enzyme
MVASQTTNRLVPAILAMEDDEAEPVALLFGRVLEGLPYYNHSAKSGELAKFTPARLRELTATDPEAILVAKIGNRPAGFCFSNRDDQTVWLSWFGVDPNHRRMGIATAMLRALEVRAKKVGSHKIWCDSRTNNEVSKLILTQLGYRELCTIPDHWYRQDFILWERLVSS